MSPLTTVTAGETRTAVSPAGRARLASPQSRLSPPAAAAAPSRCRAPARKAPPPPAPGRPHPARSPSAPPHVLTRKPSRVLSWGRHRTASAATASPWRRAARNQTRLPAPGRHRPATAPPGSAARSRPRGRAGRGWGSGSRAPRGREGPRCRLALF